MAGKIWVGTEIVLDLENLRTLQLAADKARKDKFSLLSPQEMEIVQCLVQGLTNREIEDRLGLSHHTVMNHLFRIVEKLGVSSRLEVVFLARGESSGRARVLTSGESRLTVLSEIFIVLLFLLTALREPLSDHHAQMPTTSGRFRL
jgi:DNA-binding CsgD family transcriptional regulator